MKATAFAFSRLALACGLSVGLAAAGVGAVAAGRGRRRRFPLGGRLLGALDHAFGEVDGQLGVGDEAGGAGEAAAPAGVLDQAARRPGSVDVGGVGPDDRIGFGGDVGARGAVALGELLVAVGVGDHLAEPEAVDGDHRRLAVLPRAAGGDEDVVEVLGELGRADVVAVGPLAQPLGDGGGDLRHLAQLALGLDRDAPGGDRLLHGLGQLQQPQVQADPLRLLAGRRGDLLHGPQLALLGERPEVAGGRDRVEVLAVVVLGEGDAAVARGLRRDRDLLEARLLRRAEAALAGEQLAAAVLADEDGERLDHPDLGQVGGHLRFLGRVEVGAGVVAVDHLDAVDRDVGGGEYLRHRRLLLLSLPPDAGAGAPAPHAKRATLGGGGSRRRGEGLLQPTSRSGRSHSRQPTPQELIDHLLGAGLGQGDAQLVDVGSQDFAAGRVLAAPGRLHQLGRGHDAFGPLREADQQGEADAGTVDRLSADAEGPGGGVDAERPAHQRLFEPDRLRIAASARRCRDHRDRQGASRPRRLVEGAAPSCRTA